MEELYISRVESLRRIMMERDWDAVVVSGSDPHLSEYLAPRWKQVEWLSGFTGEAADLVITLDHAGLWTDTRYFIQARRQLEGTGIELHKTRVPEQVLIPEWIASHFAGRQEIVIAFDGLCISAADADRLVDAAENEGIACRIASVPDLMSLIWKDRPAIPSSPIFRIESGQSCKKKIEWLRKYISSQCSGGILLAALDEIAWMLNVRAADIDYNPLVISYLFVTEDRVRWFVVKDKSYDDATLELFQSLRDEGIEVLPYCDVELALSEFDFPLCVDKCCINNFIFNSIHSEVISIDSPVAMKKAIKNSFEIENMRKAHLLDGIVMERFLYWLERSVDASRGISEYDAALKLSELRSEVEGYIGDSFETISAYGEGAALPHYVTPHYNAPVLYSEGLYLCDSGAQYIFGTTDITRTIPLGRCSQQEKEDYTTVLRSHIRLAMAVWPEGTPGCRLDAIAREPMWRSMKNFGHGTGHGVGYFLGVHEGPQDIRQNLNPTPLVPGMIVSNEPGIYREGLFGIRHENLQLVVSAGKNEFGSWLTFEPLTLCHFDTSIIVRSMMSADEIDWLNEYNETVYRALCRHLPSNIASWLRDKTEAI